MRSSPGFKTRGLKPIAVAGSVRYAVSEPISIARGASAMVSIINKRVAAEEVDLWRPDANAPGSDKHPFRAMKLTNTFFYPEFTQDTLRRVRDGRPPIADLADNAAAVALIEAAYAMSPLGE